MSTDVSELAEQCREEIASRSSGMRPASYCFELFRLAIVEGCQEAWEFLYEQYKERMLRWAGETAEAEDVVHRAFEKFLNAVGPDTFARFTGIAAVLAYLRRCVNSVYIDRQRQAERERLARSLVFSLDRVDSPEQRVLDRVIGSRCADYVYAHLNDEQERLVVRLNLELGIEPAEIVRRCPTVFATADEVYRVRNRVIRRLAQDPLLRKLASDLWN